jgi:hypothetical protein
MTKGEEGQCRVIPTTPLLSHGTKKYSAQQKRDTQPEGRIQGEVQPERLIQEAKYGIQDPSWFQRRKSG